ncbi:MAG TPA: ribonuclease HII [Candidatus Saccharimonadia bacterium]|nr:ribonuclease HII [Candidatus Saccharimonadia bacterium]
MITLGIDEVGRGCWAGPLVAGAVILPENLPDNRVWEVRPPKGGKIEVVSAKIVDSKKLSKKQRELAAMWIRANAVAVGLGWVWPVEIDERGLTWAVKTAMERAVAQINKDYDELIVDGNINYFADNPRAHAVIKADDSVQSVSAASIIAKVARDTYMAELGENYAGYGFERHVGYGTAAHSAALKTLGISDIHRRSFKPIQALML